MMRDHGKSIEFESVIDAGGNIQVPPEVRRQVEQTPGMKLHVRLTGSAIHASLKDRGVNEEEIERIGTLQLEPREQVVKFLLSEGACARKSGFGKRRPVRRTRR